MQSTIYNYNRKISTYSRVRRVKERLRLSLKIISPSLIKGGGLRGRVGRKFQIFQLDGLVTPQLE